MKIIRKIGLAIFNNKKILMVRTTKDNIRFLGGKVEGRETDLECLIREVAEEVSSKIDMASLKLLNTFRARVDGQPDTYVIMPLYTGNLLGVPTPTNEVVEILFVDSSLDASYKTPLTINTFRWLKDNNYIV